jgi:hypothetical protein
MGRTNKPFLTGPWYGLTILVGERPREPFAIAASSLPAVPKLQSEGRWLKELAHTTPARQEPRPTKMYQYL